MTRLHANSPQISKVLEHRPANLHDYQGCENERIAALTVERDAEKASKDMAYSERDRLVCALSKIFSAHLERHPDSDMDWENDWRWIVFVQFPTGQASWHIHDSELGWFDHLEREDGNSWDGHSTTEKYARVQRFEAIGSMKLLEAENAALKAKLEWKPITPDSLPKVGDEVLNPKHNSVTFVCADQQDVQGWLDEGYVLHRSITPPSAEGSRG